MADMSSLALCGGQPTVTRTPPAWPITDELEVAWMEGVVRSGQWSWYGPHERAFCSEFAGFIGSKYCLLLCNGTVTLQCALQAVGVEPGDEVIVPGLTWVATAQAALDIGASVVLADIDPETLCLDPAAVEAAITPRTKAIVPVHLYGCMCDMDALLALAQRHKLKVVEDVAHQHGSRWRNRGAGSVGDVGSFSFQQSKVLTCGEGGAVTCNEDAVMETVHALKHVGWKPDLCTPAQRYGHNYRGTEMQAVLLRGGLRRLPDQTAMREECAGIIRETLARLGGPLRAARRDPRITRQAYYAMTLVYDPAQSGGVSRSQYVTALRAEGCPLGWVYSPVYASPLLNFYDKTSPVPYRTGTPQDYGRLKLPNVEKAVNETAVTLGHTAMLDKQFVSQMLDAIAKVNAHLPELRAHYEQEAAKAGKTTGQSAA